MAKKKTRGMMVRKSKSGGKGPGPKAAAAMHRAAGSGLGAQRRGESVAKGFAKRKPTSKPKKKKAAKKRRAKKSFTGGIAKGGGGARRARKRGGKRMSTKVKVGRVGAKVSCPAGSTLITSSVTKKKRDAKTGKVKKMTYIAGQCVFI